jgi:peptidoglycan/xylan/chitin deacetylase (PgdA/CDA1 family)
MISIKIINKLLCVFVAIVSFSGCKNSVIGKDLGSRTDTTAVAAAKKIIEPNTPGSSSYKYDSTKKYIYFTFDDGPQPGTMNCFHIVRELGIKASFFMIGVQIDSKGLEKRVDSIRNSYPQILLCNHSFTHGNFNHYKSYYNNPDSAARDVIKAQASMRVPLKIFRMPAINAWNINGRIRSPQLTKPLCGLLGNDGYEVAGWDVEWRFETDEGSIPVQTADQMIREIQNAFRNNNETFVRDNVVVLTHDRMFAKRGYADSLRKVITAIKQDKRIVFETMDHYPGIYRK